MKNLYTFTEYKLNETLDPSPVPNILTGLLGSLMKMQGLDIDRLLGVGTEAKMSDRGIGTEYTNSVIPNTGTPATNAKEIDKAMDRHGIKNKFTRAAIQGVIGKESGWIPGEEKDYSKTDNARIRKVFPSIMKGVSDSKLNSLKGNPSKFWDFVYGPDDPTGRAQKMGNVNKGDGNKYKGRGFNGLTWKVNYKKFQDIYNKNGKLGKNVDIVKNPEALKDPSVAAEFALLFFLETAKDSKMKSKYGTNDLNSFSKLDTAVKAVANANHGIGRSLNDTIGSEGLRKASLLASDYLKTRTA